MLPTNLRSILTIIAVAATVSANPSPRLIGCVDVVDIKTGEVTNCVPVSQIPNGQDSNQAKHQGGHARRTASNENNLCVNIKYNTESTTGPDQNRCISFPVLRNLQADYQAQNKLKPRDSDNVNRVDRVDEPCLDVYYLSPKDNVTMTGPCIPITDLEKYQTVSLNYQSPPPGATEDDLKMDQWDPYAPAPSTNANANVAQRIPDLSSRDVSAGQNYTFCTAPYDIVTHLAYGSPHYLDCVRIAANALGRSRWWTVGATSQSHTLLTARTCELAVRMTGVRVMPGTIIKIGNTDIERTYNAGAKAINELPDSAGGKQALWYAQGFELEGAWDCWDNTQTERYKVYFGYMLKGNNPAWWSGMGY